MTRNPEARIDAAITQGGKTSKEDAPQSPPSSQSLAPNAAQNAQGLACSPRPEWPELGYGIHAATGALLLCGTAQTDFSLPGTLPLVWERRYSSYADVALGGFCGVLGHGWRTPLELRLEVKPQSCVLHDVDGRSIHFDALAPGESHYSPSEDLWLLRSGGDAADGPKWYASTEQRRFAHLPKEMVRRPHVIFAGHGGGDELWAFAPSNRKALEEGRDATPSEQWQLLGRIDRLGRIQRYRYGTVLGAQRLVAMQDGVGRCYRLHYEQVRSPRPEPRYPSGHFWQADSGVRLTKVELLGTPEALNALDPELLVRYVYSAEGDLIEVRNGRNGREGREEATQRFAYRNHMLTLHQERGGPEHHYRYERNEPGARVIEQRSQQGLTRHFSYQTLAIDEDKQPRAKTLMTDSFKRSTSHLFKGAAGLARLVEHTQADGSTVRRAHDAHGRLLSMTDALGHTTHYWPDAMGLPTFIQHPDGGETRNEWEAATGLLLAVTDPEGRVTRHHHDAWHRLERIQRADGSLERRVYPDPAADRSIAHLPSQITDGAGGTTRFAYSREGLLLSRSDPDGNTTQFEYCTYGRLIACINPLGETERYDYDERGQLVAKHQANGVSRHFKRDICGRVVQESVSGNAHSEAPVRSAGDVQMQYDLWGRIVEREHAGTSVKWAYDDAGRLMRCTNESGDIRHLQWDEMDRLVREIGVDGRTIEYRYGAGSRLHECTDGCAKGQDREAHTTRYEWDDAGRLASISYPGKADSEAFITRLKWTRADELQSASNWLASGATTSCSKWDRLVSRIEWRRDRLGRVIAETQRLFDVDTGKPEFEYRISHTLDGNGRRMASELGTLGTVGYEWNAGGALRSLTWQRRTQVEFARDALQRETARLLTTAGVRRRTDWNAAGLWQNMECSGDALPPSTTNVAAAAIRARQYLYDHAGHMLAIHSDVGTSRFAYDAHGRLMASHTPQVGAQRWSFDPAGLRLPQPSDIMTATHADAMEAESACVDEDSKGVVNRPESELAHTTRWAGGRVDYYTNAHDKCSAQARLCYCYDSRSNRTRVLDLHTGRAVRMHYDAANRLVAAKGVDAQGKPFAHHYQYDALGRCVARFTLDDDGKHLGAQYFGWDGDRLVHIERHATRGNAESTPLDVVHTVYEPNTRTPLLQLAKGHKAAVDQVVQTASPKSLLHEPTQSHQNMREMLKSLEDLDERIKTRLAGDSGKSANHQACLVRQVKAAQSAQQHPALPKFVDEANNIQIRHVLTDHTGSPAALLDAKGSVVWALQQDPWGNDFAEHNPLKLWQPMRAKGRHLDASTGLLMDGSGRFYDAGLGACINTGPRPVPLHSDAALRHTSAVPEHLEPPVGRGLFGPIL